MHVWTGRKIYDHSIPSSLFRWLQDRFRKVIHEFWIFGNFLLSLFLFPSTVYIHSSNLTQGTCKCGYFRMSCNSYYIFRRYLHTIEASMDLLNLRQNSNLEPKTNQSKTDAWLNNKQDVPGPHISVWIQLVQDFIFQQSDLIWESNHFASQNLLDNWHSSPSLIVDESFHKQIIISLKQIMP